MFRSARALEASALIVSAVLPVAIEPPPKVHRQVAMEPLLSVEFEPSMVTVSGAVPLVGVAAAVDDLMTALGRLAGGARVRRFYKT